MIPKKLHYCWFGRNSMSPLAKKCIKSWRKYCKDFEIIEWNEDNFDLSSTPLYVRQAYESKKWAFVTDYVRLKVVHDYGGIYLDTDVEVIRSLEDLLEYNSFFGLEPGNRVATGLGFGAVAGAPILAEVMRDYQDIPFVKEDGSLDLMSCPERNTDVFVRHGLRLENVSQILNGNIMVFPMEYFCPMDYFTGRLQITSNTYTIHHFSASWLNEAEKRKKRQRFRQYKFNRWRKKVRHIVHTPARILYRIMGEEKFNRMKSFVYRK